MPLKKSAGSSGIYFLERAKILEELRQASRRLRQERSDVEEVILFGSLSRGDYHGKSDADIAVILTESALPPEERSRELFRYFWPIKVPVDLLIYTRKEINDALAEENHFVKEFISQGLRL